MPKYVVIGGGIAGVTCVEHLLRINQHNSESRVILISISEIVKKIKLVGSYGQYIKEFDVKEGNLHDLECSKLQVLKAAVLSINTTSKYVLLDSGEFVTYDRLCICTGSSPKVLWNHNRVLALRDAHSADVLRQVIPTTRRLVVVGNGGIGLEVVTKLRQIPEIVWIIKDSSIGSTFFDSGASEFILQSVFPKSASCPLSNVKEVDKTKNLSMQYSVCHTGAALGPQWASLFVNNDENNCVWSNVVVEYDTEIASITELDTLYPLRLVLANGKSIECDLVIMGIGVVPMTHFAGDEFMKDKEGGLLVDETMRTTVKDVFAAGDCCTPSWKYSRHWFPLKLWTQAHPMAIHAAVCLVGSDDQTLPSTMFFELFTHVTKFFGFKVILLGCYNAQGLDAYELIVRYTLGKEFVKVVLSDGRVQGAVLIGDTDLEETMENLILNQIYVGHLGESLLDPSVDIEDYFD